MNKDDTTLHIERVIDAPREAVFAAWTTAAAMEEWYQDGPDYEARVLELDVRVGGGFRIEWGPADTRIIEWEFVVRNQWITFTLRQRPTTLLERLRGRRHGTVLIISALRRRRTLPEREALDS